MQAASAYIGRQVVAPGNTVGVQNDKATSIAYAPTSTDAYTAHGLQLVGPAGRSGLAWRHSPAAALQTFNWNPPSSTADGQYQVKIVNSNNVALGGLLEQGIVQSVGLDQRWQRLAQPRQSRHPGSSSEASRSPRRQIKRHQ